MGSRNLMLGLNLVNLSTLKRYHDQRTYDLGFAIVLVSEDEMEVSLLQFSHTLVNLHRRVPLRHSLYSFPSSLSPYPVSFIDQCFVYFAS